MKKKNVLLIGSSSLIGQAVLNNKKHKFTAPTKEKLDLSNRQSIEKFDYKGYDCIIIVAGAGGRHGKKFGFKDKEVDLDYIANTVDVNCKGITMLLKKYLTQNPKGNVATIGSISVVEMKTNHAVYASTKVYLDKLIDLLANLYPETNFSKINPASVNSRFQPKNSKLIAPEEVANCVWTAIEKNIKRIDIMDKTGLFY
jgi:short-subunit dehydrogenase